MCGRISLIESNKQKIKERFNLNQINCEINPRYNIAPTQFINVILNESQSNLINARWGLIPHWASNIDSKYSIINAKRETLLEKPTFNPLIRNRRCLIISDGFYEWRHQGQNKIPYRFYLSDNEIFAFAGIWDMWHQGEDMLISCAIITTAANENMKSIHDRMPVILPQKLEMSYLNETNLENVLSLLDLSRDIDLKSYEISKLVNSPKNDSSEIIVPVG